MGFGKKRNKAYFFKRLRPTIMFLVVRVNLFHHERKLFLS